MQPRTGMLLWESVWQTTRRNTPLPVSLVLIRRPMRCRQPALPFFCIAATSPPPAVWGCQKKKCAEHCNGFVQMPTLKFVLQKNKTGGHWSPVFPNPKLVLPPAGLFSACPEKRRKETVKGRTFYKAVLPLTIPTSDDHNSSYPKHCQQCSTQRHRYADQRCCCFTVQSFRC